MRFHSKKSEVRMKRISNQEKKANRLKGRLDCVDLFAAGIDIGSTIHFVAVPKELDSRPAREFSCFTRDLIRLADWLVHVGIQTIAMESTGIYWIPIYEFLEERELEALLVNAHHVKNVPGQKSDAQDCRWLQQLHTHGLLRVCFRTPENGIALRAYVRQRETLVRKASEPIQHMQKSLRQMNLLLDNVVTDITGKTGLGIINAILEGEHDSAKLAKLRDCRCKHDEEP